MHTGIALVTGSEDLQWLYPAMTRGTDANLAFVFTTPARPADPQPGTRPAPGLGRYDRLRRERAGHHPGQLRPGSPGRAADPRQPWPWSPTSSAATAPAFPPLRCGSATSPTPTTWPPSTRSGPLKPKEPAMTGTGAGHGRASARPPAAALASGPLAVPHPARRRTGRPGPPRSSARPSPNETWSAPGTSPASWTPGSARGSIRLPRNLKDAGPDEYLARPTPAARPT